MKKTDCKPARWSECWCRKLMTNGRRMMNQNSQQSGRSKIPMSLHDLGRILLPELPKTGGNDIWNFVLGGLFLIVGGVFAAQRRRQA